MSISIFIPLVNENDEIIGHEEKLRVHELGLLHRAFSILVYNNEEKLLIHQRAMGKYHSPGLWTNTCCGHPNKDETMENAVHRRLQEEMGFDCELQHKFTFQYRAEFSNGLIENEIDHVYIGTFNDSFVVNPEEVNDYMWVDIPPLKVDVAAFPDKYTVWFREILERI